jgi:outer membrane biosynthesis protein TonB
VTPSFAAPPVNNEPRTLRLVFTALAVCGIALGAVWAGVRLSHTHAGVSQDSQTASMTPQSPPAASPPAAEENLSANIPRSPPTVLHQEIPEVSRRARESIRGVILITVRATVDRSGNVVAATLDNEASSRYFTRSAIDAAKKWKFAQAADAASRVWLLHFEFSREGTTAHSAAIQG